MQRIHKGSRTLLLMLVFMLAFSPLSVLADEGKTNTIHYVALGDSLAYGTLSDGEKGAGYVSLIESDLKAKGYVVTPQNEGVSGFTTGDVLVGLSGISELADADIITLSAGANDILAGLMPILNSGINPADVTPEKLAALQQAAEEAAEAVTSSGKAARNAINDANTSNDVTQDAGYAVEQAALTAAAGIVPYLSQLTPEQQAVLGSIPALIQDARDGTGNAASYLNDALMAFLESRGQADVADNLANATSNLDTMIEKLNLVVGNIEVIEVALTSLGVDLPSAQTAKTKANEAIEAAKTTKSMMETAELAIDTFYQAEANAETAKLAAENAVQLAAQLKQMLDEIPGIIQDVGTNTAQILGAIRSVNPSAKIYVMGYYNALPYLPAQVQESMTEPMLFNLNAAIATAAGSFGAEFIPVAQLFEGNFQTYLPNTANIHPSMAGYEAIAGAFNGAINLSFPKIEKPDSVDKDALNNLITKAKKYGADDYTQDSFKALEAAITLAENVLQDDDATQDEVDQALAALQDAIDNLKDAAVPVVDKNALNNLITKAKKYEADDYTQDSFKALGAAIAHAEDVFQNEDATQDVVDQALAQLKVAIDNLKKAPIKEEVAKIPSKGSKSDFINEKGNSISIMNKGKRGTLPNTATNTFNYLALGITLLTLGAMSIVVTRRKKRSMSSK